MVGGGGAGEGGFDDMTNGMIDVLINDMIDVIIYYVIDDMMFWGCFGDVMGMSW